MQPDQQVAAWRVGPPAPKAFSWATRGLQLATLATVLIWVFGYLGGLRLTPRPLPDGSGNDTGQLFNWHPILMVGAVALMGEAMLAFKPLAASRDRAQRKSHHVALQSGALALATLALVAVFRSHTQKRPVPMSNLYSVHSWLGMAVCVLFLAQFLVGLSAYVVPQWHAAHRAALGPVHAFIGMGVYVGGAAAAVAGIQEKATFVQFVAKPGVHSGVMAAPAALGVLVMASAGAVLYHHAPSAAARRRQQHEDEAAEAGPAGAAQLETLPLRVGRLS